MSSSRFRYVTDALRMSARVTATFCVRSGSSATNVTAVMSFVRLAIDRWSCEFSSQRTLSGLRVVDDRGRGADVGNQVAELVALEPRRHRLALSCARRATRARAAARARDAARARARLVRVCVGLAAVCLLGRLRLGCGRLRTGGARLSIRTKGRCAGQNQQRRTDDRHSAGEPRQRHVSSSTRCCAARNLLPFRTNHWKPVIECSIASASVATDSQHQFACQQPSVTGRRRSCRLIGPSLGDRGVTGPSGRRSANAERRA